MAYRRSRGVDTAIVRIFNTYGPRMHPDDGRVVSNLVLQALRGEPITIYGDGKQTRSFCYIDDLVDALVLLMDTDPSVTGPVNLGNPVECTMIELARKILALTHSKSPIVFRELPADDPHRRRPDISLAERLLDWRPKVSLDEGLQKTIAYFDRLLRGERFACG